MQCFIIGTLIIIFYIKVNKKVGIFLIGILIAIHTISNWIIAAKYDLKVSMFSADNGSE